MHFGRPLRARTSIVAMCGLALVAAGCTSILGAESDYRLEDGSGGGAGGPPEGGASGAPPTGGASGAHVGGAAGGGHGGSAGGAPVSGMGGAAGSKAGAGGAGHAGAGGTEQAGAAGTKQGGTAGTKQGGAAGTQQGGSGGTEAGAGGTEQAGAGGTEAGGSAGVDQGGSGGDEAGAAGADVGGTAGTGGTVAGAGGSVAGQAGQGGSAPTDPCCTAELQSIVADLASQYQDHDDTTAYSFPTPKSSLCYSYSVVTNSNSVIQFSAKSKVAGCPNAAAEVTGYDASTGKELATVATGLCGTPGVSTLQIVAATAVCSIEGKIACADNQVLYGSPATTAANCAQTVCDQCEQSEIASIQNWIAYQKQYYAAHDAVDISFKSPSNSPCYSYTVTYVGGGKAGAGELMVDAQPAHAGCKALDSRVEANKTSLFYGICEQANSSDFVDDCQYIGGTVTPVQCQGGSVSVGADAQSTVNKCP